MNDTPILFWVCETGRLVGMRMYIRCPSLDELRKVVQNNPLAWIEA